MITEGVLLAGGQATRLAPFNKFISKNLMNVGGKCIIDYSIATLKESGIENLTIVVGSAHAGQIIDYIQDGEQYNLNINFVVQKEPKGISHAIFKCKRFINKPFICILGDNYYNEKINWSQDNDHSEIVLTKHSNLNRFGVASIKNEAIYSIVEKPQILQSSHDIDNYVITGCYKLTCDFFDYFSQTTPSKRGEFEITEILNLYLLNNKLLYNIYRGKWWDIGTHDAIAQVNNYLFNKNKQ